MTPMLRAAPVDRLLETIGGQPVLTVADIPGFARAGGILDLTQLEAGGAALQEHPLNLISTVEDCFTAYRPLAESKGIAFESAWLERPPSRVRTDGKRLVDRRWTTQVSNYIKK